MIDKIVEKAIKQNATPGAGSCCRSGVVVYIEAWMAQL